MNKIIKILKILQNRNTMLGRMSKKYDAYEVLISTILSARAKDEVTEVIAENLFKKYPTAEKLAKAKSGDVKKIIKKIGFYNNKTKNIINTAKKIVKEYNSKVPNKIEQLMEFPGVGRKVANCVLVYSFGIDAIPVDTHVHRLSNRIGLVKTKTPEQTEKQLEKITPKKYWQLVNDTFVAHGKTICKPINPKCPQCTIYKYCKRINVKK